MKFRKYLLALRLWARALRARRALSRLRRDLEDYRKQEANEKQRTVAFYEAQLAYERTRNETLHTEWANRFLQFQNLAPLGISSSLIEERAAAKLPPRHGDFDLEAPLTSSQMVELENRKELFFRDGFALEKSASEIQNRWNDIKTEVIQDVKMAIN